MDIRVGKTAGFCYGVERAVEGVKRDLETEKNIYCLGEIVHNKEVIQYLTKRGMKIINKLEEAKEKIVIRAHGISNEVRQKAKDLGIELIDYTCPKVLKIHEIADVYRKKGFYIFLLGTPNHPENIGTISFCGKNSYIIEEKEDLNKAFKNLQKSNIKKLLIIEQTTYSVDKCNQIIEEIKKIAKKNIEITVKNTICLATKLRQKETEEISQKVDCMIIIGGKNSSNTKKLYETAQKNCIHTFYIQTKEDLPIKEIQQFEKIGIMAGASTPPNSIDEVINKLKEKEKILA